MAVGLLWGLSVGDVGDVLTACLGVRSTCVVGGGVR